MNVLNRDFFCRDPVEVARELLGKLLHRRTCDGLTVGIIVETEAYLHLDDSACHAARGKTRSNASMFGSAGNAYVYPIHSRYCFNTVTQSRGIASAVLIRAVEPIDGIAIMQRRRGGVRPLDLTRGPGRLCQAFDIDRRLDRWGLGRGRRLWISDAAQAADNKPIGVGRSVRIGVTSAQDLPLRFFVRGNRFVSGPRRLNPNT